MDPGIYRSRHMSSHIWKWSDQKNDSGSLGLSYVIFQEERTIASQSAWEVSLFARRAVMDGRRVVKTKG